jgi:hypothetical protein
MAGVPQIQSYITLILYLLLAFKARPDHSINNCTTDYSGGKRKERHY